MSDSAGNCSERYVYYLNGKSKTTYLIYGPVHSSDECKVLGDFGYKYVKIRSNKERGHNPLPKNKFKKHQEKPYFDKCSGWNTTTKI